MEGIVREVTAEEVAHYAEFGWAMLRALVTPAFAGEILRVAAALAAEEQHVGQLAKRGVEPFRSLMWSQRMAQNATRLVDRARLKGTDVPLRWRQDLEEAHD
jgi:hypothetical protein